LTEQAKI